MGVRSGSWRIPTTLRERHHQDKPSSDEETVPREEVTLRDVILDDTLAPEVKEEQTSGSATPENLGGEELPERDAEPHAARTANLNDAELVLED